MSEWNTPVSNGEGGDYEIPPAGLHPAYCVGLIDLGTHDRTYNNETTEAHKILLVFELTAEKDSKGDSFLVHRDFNWTLTSAKSKLRQFLEGWNGKAFIDGEQIDLAGFVKQPCMVNLSEGLSAKQKKFIEIAGVTKPMRGLSIPAMTVQPVLFNLAGHHSAADEPPIPGYIPPIYGRKVIDEIKASKEWGKLPNF